MTVYLSALAGAGAQFLDNNGDILSGGKDRRDHILDCRHAPQERGHRIDEEDGALAVSRQQIELVRDACRAVGRDAGDRACEIVCPVGGAGAVGQRGGIFRVDGQVDSRHYYRAVAAGG